MTHTRIAVALLAMLCLGACGAQQVPQSSGPLSPSRSGSAPVVDPSGEVVAHGMLMQDSPTAPVELCMGGVDTSYPPQCGGPTVVGEIPWDALGPEEASGVRWTNREAWVVGRFDADEGRSGELILTRPVSMTPPAGADVPTASAPTFPQLCEDPYADGGLRGAGSGDERNALVELLPTIDGYIGSWVSDGSSLINVLVTGDAGVAQSQLRQHWPGGLCVEQRALPTEADVLAAQGALDARFGVLLSGAQAMTGGLDVHVTLLDRTTLEGILATVRPWLTPDQVRVTSAFQPMSR